jgi:replicative DNA helicase
MKSPEDTFAAIAAGLKAEHFVDGGARFIFSAIIRAADRARSTEVSSVWAEMQGVAVADRAPIGLTQLVEIDDLCPTSVYRGQLVDKTMGAARLRKMSTELARASEMAKQSPRQTFAEAWEEVAPVLARVQSLAISDQPERTFAEACEAAKRAILDPDTRKVIRHPFASWEMRSSAFREGQMIVFAGRPGAGKSALAFQIAEHVSRTQGHVAAFSLEMSAEELIERLALAQSEAPERPQLVAKAINGIARNKRFHLFDNSASYTMDTIEARCQMLAAVHGSLSLIVIDYLQLLEPTDRRMPREQQVAEMSRRCKKLAGRLKVPVIILAQLNRESEKEERMPRMSDLRESGAIEQDADRIWLLWYESKDGGDNSQPNIDITLIQAKCRGGPRDIATKLLFQRSIFTFKPIEYNNYEK